MRLDHDQGQDVRPPVFEALRCYGGTIYYPNGMPHPLAYLSASWRKVLVAAETFFANLDQLAVRPALGGKNGDLQLATANCYADLVYRATEFIEGVADNLKGSLFAKGQGSWNPSVRGTRKPIDMICNKLKHNHRTMNAVVVQSLFGRADGFFIGARDENGAVAPDADIHPDVGAFSYAIHSRRLFWACYKVGEEAAREVRRLGFDQPKSDPSVDAEFTLRVLRKVAALKPIPFQTEDLTKIPLIQITGEVLVIEEAGERAIPRVGRVSHSTTWQSDGVSKMFKLPFHRSQT